MCARRCYYFYCDTFLIENGIDEATTRKNERVEEEAMECNVELDSPHYTIMNLHFY